MHELDEGRNNIGAASYQTFYSGKIILQHSKLMRLFLPDLSTLVWLLYSISGAYPLSGVP
jgi:hypothetical protein